MSRARYEVVQGDAVKPWFWRFISSNGREISRSSQTYARKVGAERAIECHTDEPLLRVGSSRWASHGRHGWVHVRYVDEREVTP